MEYGLLAAFVALLGVACVVKDPLKLAKAIEGVFKSAVKMIEKKP